MAANTLKQINAELGSIYNPQINNLKSQQGLIPQQIADEEKGLQAKQTQAFDDITAGARRKGMGFSGIPLGEQAKYTSTEFLPALARLRQQGREKQLSLEEAILGVGERRGTLAQQLYQQRQDRLEQQRQFNLNLKLQREQMAASQRAARAASGGGGGGFSPSYGGGGGGAAPAASFQRKKDGGFAFTNSKGQPISAAKYAQATGSDIRDVLRQMGQQGDRYAAQLYNQLRMTSTYNDFKKRPDVYKRMYSPIFWGT